MLRTISDIVSLSRIRPLHIAFLINIILLQSIFDLLGLGLLIGFISYAWLGISDKLINGVALFLESAGFQNGTTELITFLFMFFAARFCAFSLTNYYILYFSAASGLNLRNRLFNELQKKPYQDLMSYKLSDMQRNIYDLVNGFVGQGIASTLRLSADLILVLLAIFCIIAMMGLSFISGIFILILIILLLDQVLKFYQQDAGEGSAVASKGTFESIKDYFYSLKFIKCSEKDHFLRNQLYTTSASYALHWRRSVFLNSLPRYILEFLVVISCLIYIYITSSNETSKLNEHFLVLVLFLRLLPIGNSISTSLAQIRNCKYLVQEIKSTLQTSMPDAKRVRGTKVAKISLTNLTISIGNRTLIKALTTDIFSGEIIGIVGPTGSGKSTLTNVLAGLRAPTDGTIEFYSDNGCKTHTPLIGYIDQYPFVVNGTLAENICLETNATLSDTMSGHLRKLGLEHLITSKPAPLNGENLSGGEIQRLNFVRALFVDSNVLIMDEPSSSLDSHTSAILQKIAIDLTKLGYVIIIITHDTNMLEIFDKIITINNGEADVNDQRRNT